MAKAAIILGCAAFQAAAAEPGMAERVVILANRDDPDSMRLARHYAEVRGVPAANLIALKMSGREEISWREFVATLWIPLLDQLVALGWIDATRMELTDGVGRRKLAPRGHRLAALVVCRGVPLKIAHAREFAAENLPLTRRAELRTNAGAVDAELALLAEPNYPINAFVPNPFFQNDQPSVFERARVVKVSRLDGPTFAEANALVDRAVAAERHGLLGRAYVDLAQREEMGDRWLQSAATQLAALGFNPDVDREPATMPLHARFDAPVLYFGWYASDLNGPFTLPGFRFPPGAIALHIHSFSASTLRAASGPWTSALVARGVTGTVGNVYEPYLQFTHRPDLFLRALARGWSLVDAALYALPVLSWHAVLVGDPLYRPFAVSTEEQIRNVERLPAGLGQYAVARRINQLDSLGRQTEATSLGLAALRQQAPLALGVAVARRAGETGDGASLDTALEVLASVNVGKSDQWALAREAALLLAAQGQTASAYRIWQALFALPALPRELQMRWLPDAIEAARRAQDATQTAAWEATLHALQRDKK